MVAMPLRCQTSQSRASHPLSLGGDQLSVVNQPVRRNRATVWVKLTCVVEDDNAVAEQAPPLLGVEGDGAGRVTIWAVSGRAWGLVVAHGSPLGCCSGGVS
jgi:hypothetical protein